MNEEELTARFRELCAQQVAPPASGQTPERHRRLMEVGLEDLSLAKLVEAHWDAVAILREDGREPVADSTYAVWASEIPGQAMALVESGEGFVLSGVKRFCSGAGLVDRALMTAGEQMVDVDLQSSAALIEMDGSGWKTEAFRLTQTSTLTLHDVPLQRDDVVGGANWYVERPGFWHGACGPAACWAGGAAGLVGWAKRNRRTDAHTLAHLGAMDAGVWAMEAVLEQAGREIDAVPGDRQGAMVRALRVRHAVEQGCTEVLRRFARAYGPHPLAMDAEMLRRYQELDLYVRQSHAERDLESLGRCVLLSSGREEQA